MVKIIELKDGTHWSTPAIESLSDPEWILRYKENELTKSERLQIASILDSYAALLYDGTTENAIKALRELRAKLKQC